MIKQLRKIILFSILLLTGNDFVFGQIIYHDLNPDVIFPSVQSTPSFSYALDIDSNGTNDYFIRQEVSPAGTISYMIGGYSGNKICVFSSNFVDALNYGNQVSISSNFNSFNTVLFDASTGNVGPWHNATNKFVGICFNSPAGLKCGWIRIGNMMTILDYAYNNSPAQSILAGEGLPNNPMSLQLYDTSDFGNGTDMKVKFYKVFEEQKIAGYKIIVVPSSNLSTFNIDSAKQVFNSNAFLIPPMNKNIDTILNPTSTDVYGNPITTLKPYKAFVLTFPDLVTAFDTLMSAASNEITLQNPTSPAQLMSVTAVKIPGSFYNLNISFNPPVNEAGILNYRLYFINESDSTKFNIDTANSVSSINYIVIPKTGTSQNLVFQSNVVKTHLGNTLKAFMKYKAVLMSVNDTVNTTMSVLSNVSNSFIVYTQVLPVNEIIVTDVADSHDISDINVFFKKVSDESGISGYRGLIIPETALAVFNLDSANACPHYIGFIKNGQDQNSQLPSSLTDVHGNIVQESQTYYFAILTINDNNLSDVNALSTVSKYFGFNTADYFYAGCRDSIEVVYHNIKDTSLFVFHLSGSVYIKNYSLDIDADGIMDLKFECGDIGGNGAWSEYANVTPLNGAELNFTTPSSAFLTRSDSADMIYDDMNWKSSVGKLSTIGMGMSGSQQVYSINGQWQDTVKKFIAIRLIGVDTAYAWISLAMKPPPKAFHRSLGIVIYDYAYQEKSVVAVSNTNTTIQNTPVSGNIATNDVNVNAAQNPTFTVTQPASTTGTITLNPSTGAYTFTPNSTFTGTTSTSYTVCNISGSCSNTTLTFTVYPTLVANPDVITTTPSVTATETLTTNDGGVIPEGTYSVTVTQTPAGTGTIIVNTTTGQYTFTPDPAFTGTVLTTYTVCNTAVNPTVCSNTTITINVSEGPQIGIKENNDLKNILLFPNPASEYVHISFNKADQVKYTMELMGVDGKLILSKSISNNEYILSTAHLAKGIYGLRIFNEDGQSKIFKLIIQ